MDQRELLKQLILKSIRKGGLSDLPRIVSAPPKKKSSLRPVIRSAPRITSVDAHCLQPKLSKKFPADFFVNEQSLNLQSIKKLPKRSMHTFKRANNQGNTLKELLCQLPKQSLDAQPIQPQQQQQYSLYNTPTFYVKTCDKDTNINPFRVCKENDEMLRPKRSQSQRPQSKRKEIQNTMKEYTVQTNLKNEIFRIRRLF